MIIVSELKSGMSTDVATVAIGTTVRPLLDQSIETFPYESIVIRVAFMPWLFFCIIISETYRGTLISSILETSSVTLPETFQELLESNATIFVKSQKNTLINSAMLVLDNEFKDIGNVVYREVALKLKSTCQAESSLEMIHRILQKNQAAFISSRKGAAIRAATS
ncbi:unnamed protein product, partial [Allacma fusca]